MSQRQAVANWFLSNYNSTVGLIQGDWVGSCGFQPNAFTIIDVNFFAAEALQPYNASVAHTISANVNADLASVGYQDNDRRGTLFGESTPIPPLIAPDVTIKGSPPPSNCSQKTSFWVVTELADTSRPLTNYSSNMNYLVPVVLQDYKSGDIKEAKSLFNTALNWWNGVGFMDGAAQTKGVFDTRSLAYFLYMQRATGFHVNSTTMNQIQTQLWSLQVPQFDGGIATTYRFNGEAIIGHTSGEINGLVLLAYDNRIVTSWYPHDPPGQQEGGFTLPTGTISEGQLAAASLCLTVGIASLAMLRNRRISRVHGPRRSRPAMCRWTCLRSGRKDSLDAAELRNGPPPAG